MFVTKFKKGYTILNTRTFITTKTILSKQYTDT